jgi:hypothetical protein
MARNSRASTVCSAISVWRYGSRASGSAGNPRCLGILFTPLAATTVRPERVYSVGGVRSRRNPRRDRRWWNELQETMGSSQASAGASRQGTNTVSTEQPTDSSQGCAAHWPSSQVRSDLGPSQKGLSPCSHAVPTREQAAGESARSSRAARRGRGMARSDERGRPSSFVLTRARVNETREGETAASPAPRSGRTPPGGDANQGTGCFSGRWSPRRRRAAPRPRVPARAGTPVEGALCARLASSALLTPPVTPLRAGQPSGAPPAARRSSRLGAVLALGLAAVLATPAAAQSRSDTLHLELSVEVPTTVGATAIFLPLPLGLVADCSECTSPGPRDARTRPRRRSRQPRRPPAGCRCTRHGARRGGGPFSAVPPCRPASSRRTTHSTWKRPHAGASRRR